MFQGKWLPTRLGLLLCYLTTRIGVGLALQGVKLLPQGHPYRIVTDSYLRYMVGRLKQLPRWGILPY